MQTLSNEYRVHYGRTAAIGRPVNGNAYAIKSGRRKHISCAHDNIKDRKMPRNIKTVFLLTSFLDKARWHSVDNYNLINFFSNRLTADEKLLTHWICYITDRQMGFERIWDVAGFIFSEIVSSIRSKKDISKLNPNNPCESFFIRTNDFEKHIGNQNYCPTNTDGYVFVGKQKVAGNETLSYYGFSPDEYAFFSSRYYPSDYRSILFTFILLGEFQLSLTKYMIYILNKNVEKPDIVKRLLYSLFLLTYFEIGQPSKENIDFKKWYNEGIQRKDKILKLIDKKDEFEASYADFCKAQIFKQKRAWCSLRDFFKSPEFSSFFFAALRENGFNNIALLQNPALLKQIELPGDVWNNNSTFRKCMLSGTRYEQSNSSFNILLRNIFNSENITEGYPEQFDVTFDFAPRMCDKWNCDLCIYGKDIGYGKDLIKICVKDSNKFCPVVLASCGYKVQCNPNDCLLSEMKYV
jgi:hypothetical protein